MVLKVLVLGGCMVLQGIGFEDTLSRLSMLTVPMVFLLVFVLAFS